MSESKFTKHAQSDPALSSGPSDSEQVNSKGGITILGRISVFLIFPSIVGGLSLLVGLLSKHKNAEYQLNLDRDFVFPFFLALSLVLLITFQTKGFSKYKPDALMKWPKVKKQRRVIHKHIVVGQEEGDSKKDD
jgi:hypothetical protein